MFGLTEGDCKIMIPVPPSHVFIKPVVPCGVSLPTRRSAHAELPYGWMDPDGGKGDKQNLKYVYVQKDVSENYGTPKSSILIGFSIINHPFWGTPIFGHTHISIVYIIYRIIYSANG